MLHEQGCSCESCQKAKAVQPPMTPAEKRLYGGVLLLQERQSAEVDKRLKTLDSTDAADYVFDVAKWADIYAEELRDLIMPLLLEGWHRAERDLAKRTGKALTKADELFPPGWEVFNAEVLEWAKSYPRTFGERVSRSFATRITREVAVGLSEGKTGSEIARDLNAGLFGGTATRSRCETIARTEASRANNAGQEQAWVQSDVVIGKTWLTNQGACEWCVEMNGKRIDLGGTYFDLGQSLEVEGAGTMSFTYETVQRPPLHPRCRCDELAVVINPETGEVIG